MKRYRRAVSALVLRPSSVCSPDGCGAIQSILLVHKSRTHDRWQLPQGGIEEGETVEQAALRELHEEAGLKLSSVASVSTATYQYDFPQGFIDRHQPINDGQTLSFVVIEAPDSCVVTVDNDEIDNYAWVLPEELPKYLDRPAYREVVEKVLKEYEMRMLNG